MKDAADITFHLALFWGGGVQGGMQRALVSLSLYFREETDNCTLTLKSKYISSRNKKLSLHGNVTWFRLEESGEIRDGKGREEIRNRERGQASR